MFQSTRPARGATGRHFPHQPAIIVSIHAPRAGRDGRIRARETVREVSIHAPRAGRDSRSAWWSPPRSCFNPRAPRGARLETVNDLDCMVAFQSTRPARGATWDGCFIDHTTLFQSTRPARGATWAIAQGECRDLRFNPRAPRGARHPGGGRGRCRAAVSIHAPRAGRDPTSPWTACSASACFNPRAPRGARRCSCSVSGWGVTFQSTRPARGATRHDRRGPGRAGVSIHAPRAGRDGRGLVRVVGRGRFNPRAPRGARRCNLGSNRNLVVFQSTRPARGATFGRWGRTTWCCCFNPRAPRGARRQTRRQIPRIPRFNPRAPRGARHPVRRRGPRARCVSIHAPRAGRDEDALA